MQYGGVMADKVIITRLNQSAWEIYFISEIAKKLSWEIIFWEVEESTEPLAKKLLPDANIVANSGGKSALYNVFKHHEWPLVDEKVVKEMSEHELILWPCFLRNSQTSGIRADISMKDEYHRAITFRYYFMKNYRPDLYFLGNVPTGFYALLDYLICKKWGIKTIILRRTELPGLYAMPISSLELHSEYIKDIVNGKKISGKSGCSIYDQEVDRYIKNLKGDYQNAMPGEYGKVGGFNKAYKINKKTGKLSARHSLVSKILKESLEQKGSRVKFIVKAIAYSVYRRYVLHSYNKLVSDKLFNNDKYVLVNLHYQPEASSIPMGGVFAYQELVISMISRTLPEGWYVYVKEHPSHLLNNRIQFSLKFRHPDFYKNIAQYKNVKIVPVSENNFRLIDEAQAVATLTGTAGFEAINRGIACLAFGFPWYMYVDGCMKIENIDDLRDAILKIKNGYKPSGEYMCHFINCVLDNSIPGMFLTSEYDIENQVKAEVYGKSRAEKFVEIVKRQNII